MAAQHSREKAVLPKKDVADGLSSLQKHEGCLHPCMPSYYAGTIGWCNGPE